MQLTYIRSIEVIRTLFTHTRSYGPHTIFTGAHIQSCTSATKPLSARTSHSSLWWSHMKPSIPIYAYTRVGNVYNLNDVFSCRLSRTRYMSSWHLMHARQACGSSSRRASSRARACKSHALSSAYRSGHAVRTRPARSRASPRASGRS